MGVVYCNVMLLLMLLMLMLLMLLLLMLLLLLCPQVSDKVAGVDVQCSSDLYICADDRHTSHIWKFDVTAVSRQIILSLSIIHPVICCCSIS